MKEFLDEILITPLFKGIERDELSHLLSCLRSRVKEYEKGEYVIRSGETTDSLALLLSGHLWIQNDDWWGKRTIMREIQEKEIFLEPYAAENIKTLNDVVASEKSKVLFLSMERILSPCSSCSFHITLERNLLSLIAEKNRKLLEKLTIISKRSTREKIISYLSSEARKNGRSSFSIPFNREEMAFYLSVDRSALSVELGKLRDQGLIEFKKNHFTLKS